MAAARRLSELLQEQQEPFLVEAAARARRPRRGRGGSGSAAASASAAAGGGTGCCPAAACRRLLRLCNHGFKKRSSASGGVASGLRSALSKVLCSRAMRRVLRWDDLGGGCFSSASACGARQFRRLRRRSIGDSGECDPRRHGVPCGRCGGRGGADGVEGRHGRRLVAPAQLGLRPRPALRRRRRRVAGAFPLLKPIEAPLVESPLVVATGGDEKPSTSGTGSSPPSESFLGPTSPCFSYNLHDKFCEMEVDDAEAEEETVRNGSRSIEEQISSWEKIAGDISRIPAMMELDLSRSARQWREPKPEVREIGARIETLIFDDIRSETVCDMLASHCRLATATATTSC